MIVRVWGACHLSEDQSALDRVAARRLILAAVYARTVPAGLKLSRRSRRRWRGTGGRWAYPPAIETSMRELGINLT